MNNKDRQQKRIIRTLLVSSLLTIGLNDFQLRQGRAQVIWKPINAPKTQSSTVNWESMIFDSVRQAEPPANWEIVPELKDKNQPPSVVWEVLEFEDDAFIQPPEKKTNPRFINCF